MKADLTKGEVDHKANKINEQKQQIADGVYFCDTMNNNIRAVPSGGAGGATAPPEFVEL